MSTDFESILHRLESDAAFSPAELDAISAQIAPALSVSGTSEASDAMWALVIQRRHTPSLLPLARNMQARGDDWAAYVLCAIAFARGLRTPELRDVLNASIAQLRTKFASATALVADPECEAKAKSLTVTSPEGTMTVEATVHAALALYTKGEYARADAACAAVLAALPVYPDALAVAAVTLKALRRYPQAVEANLRAIWLAPVSPVAMSNLSSMMIALQRGPDAQRFAELALAVDNKRPEAWVNLAGALGETPGRAEAAARAAIKLLPANASAHLNLGNALKQQGRLDEAVACYREVIKLKPADQLAYQNILVTIQYSDAYSPADVAAEHFRFAERFEAPVRPAKPVFANDRDPERPLRVGFVSGDFRDHACSYFVEPLWAHLDKANFPLTAYSTKFGADDAVGTRLRSHTALWRDVSTLPDAETADAIRNDRIDILFDIAGHTAGNRLMAFAREAAPVQVTWLGNPNTTGLKSMGWRLSDPLTDPPGSEKLYSEKLYRLPDIFCVYRPMIRHPERRNSEAYATLPTPALRNGYVTYGTCNNLAKLSTTALRVWGRILARVPTARLLIEAKDVEHPQLRKAFLKKAADAGIPVQRLDLVGRDYSKQYLRYHEIDVALDPFPANGGTTTCDVLWMGTPMVTMPGDAFFARMGFSLSTAAGLTDLIAQDEAHYVELAVGLAGSVSALNRRRLDQRAIVEASALMDEARYARNVEKALRDMWRDWVGRKG
jgi:protein O-GlcNAc transferase